MDEKISSSGFSLNKKTIAGLAGLMVLLVATGIGVYLTQQKQIFKPKAYETKPVSGPETSFTLVSPSFVNIGKEVRVSLLVRSDIDTANLFAAKLRFPTELLEVKSIIVGAEKAEKNDDCVPPPPCMYSNPQCFLPEPIEGWCPIKVQTCGGVANLPCPIGYTCQVNEKYPDASGVCVSESGVDDTAVGETENGVVFREGGGLPEVPPSFIKNWVEKTFDNSEGTISLVGGVPDPGFKTNLEDPSAFMAEVVFKTKTNGIAIISFDSDSAIYRNSDNVNILNIKRETSFKIQSPAPSVTSVPQPQGSRVFVTSTTYNGNLGGLAGADAKCQASANNAKLGGTWKAWLSDSTTSAASRLVHDTGPYKLLNSSVIANNWIDLIDGTLQSPINVTEKGSLIPQPAFAWTNTNYQGVSFGGDNNCANFTSSAGAVYTLGMPGSTSAWWTQMSTNNTYCANAHSLYCFEQVVSTPDFSCDVNGDGVKDTKDGDLIKSCWNKPATGVCAKVDTDGDGNITMADIQKFSSRCPEIFVTSSTTPTPTSAGVKGDINGDGKITLQDMSALLSRWGKTGNEAGGADLNGDGLVNTIDYSMMIKILIDNGVIKSPDQLPSNL